jgi:hypothetical protein
MRVNWRRFWLIAVTVMIVLVVASAIHHHLEAVQTRRAIAEAEGLCGQIPVGTHRAGLEAILQRRGIEHSYKGESKNWPEGAGTESAIIRNVCGTHLVSCDVVFSFSFDESDLLKHCSAKDIYSGP